METEENPSIQLKGIKHARLVTMSNSKSSQVKIREAQAIEFPRIFDILNPEVYDVVTALSQSIGCPVEFIFVPLLTCIAGMYIFRLRTTRR